MRLTRTVVFATLFQEFDEEESLALEHSLFGAKESSEVGDQFSARKLRFELDLQDGVLTKASPMLGRMKILATFARRAGNAPQSDLCLSCEYQEMIFQHNVALFMSSLFMTVIII